jgi:protein SCO1/2
LSAEPKPVSPLKRFLLAAVLCLVIGVSGGLLAAESRSPSPVGLARFTPPHQAAFDFHLRDQHGRETSLRTARGKVVVLTFLYTACQDLCPAQAAEIVDAVTRVGGKGVMVYGVSVDPEYLKSGGRPQPYHPPSRPAPAAAKQSFPDTNDLAYRGRPRHAAGTQYEHSAYVLLVDPQGVQRVGFPFEQLDPARLAQDIRLLRNS